jgi:hypothetical protein
LRIIYFSDSKKKQLRDGAEFLRRKILPSFERNGFEYMHYIYLTS